MAPNLSPGIPGLSALKITKKALMAPSKIVYQSSQRWDSAIDIWSPEKLNGYLINSFTLGLLFVSLFPVGEYEASEYHFL